MSVPGFLITFGRCRVMVYFINYGHSTMAMGFSRFTGTIRATNLYGA